MTEVYPPDIGLLEQAAYRVLNSIERTITAIQGVEAFSPNNRKRPPLDQVNLVSILESNGIFQNVKEAMVYVQEILEIDMTSDWMGGDTSSDTWIDIHGNQRRTVLRLVLLPLLDALFICYRFIDRIPQPSPQQSPRKKNDTTQRPSPPRGMLSLQNYTDVGAMIEFTVCSSVLPCLEQNVLVSARDRAQYLLPKSLAGRLPRFSLLWGTAVMGQDNTFISNEIRLVVRTIGNVVLLDRFRPMFLPRHLADLYAGIFQAEAIEGSQSQDPSLSFVNSCLLPSKQLTTPYAVDPINQARALQSLLLRGTTGPGWLRKRVSNLLTDLATRDLFAIVQVFVISAVSSQADMTGAALRLAKTLMVVNEDKDYSPLCLELVRFLDVDVETLTTTEFACALVVWACLDQFTRRRAVRHFLPLLSEGAFPIDASSDPHRTVRRALVLFAVTPTSNSAASVCELILSAIPKSSATTLFSQFVRLASFPSIDEASIKSDAAMALRMFFSLMERTCFTFNGEKVEGVVLLSVSLLYAVTPNKWDMDGHQYRHAFEADNRTASKTSLTLLTTRQHPTDEATVLHNTSKRASIIVTEAVGTADLKPDSILPTCIFQFLLATIFRISQSKPSNHESGDLRLSVMILLPVLCEAFTPDALLVGNSSDACGVLAIIKLILDCAAMSVDDSFLQMADNIGSDTFRSFDKACSLSLDLAPESHRKTTEETGSINCELEDMLMSTTGIALSLLTAMLELGSAQRNTKEAAILQESLPALRALSSFPSQPRYQGIEEGRQKAEMAEMASHAAALIIAMYTGVKPMNNTHQPQPTSVVMMIAEAENDVQSEHPATRAQGVVKLRHLARGYLDEKGEKLQTKPLIMDVAQPLSDQINDNILHKLLGVCMLTLADSESYVYLAGIQSIVAIADVDPQVIVPLIGVGICTGEVHLNTGSQLVVQLSQDDRIKLSEALLFVLRRRGPSIHQYMLKILVMMTHGYRKIDGSKSPSDAKIIQEETHNFFTVNNDDTNELTSTSDRLETKLIRAHTGGPVFTTELSDVLRSSCIAIVTELVDAALPSSIAAHASAFVTLVHNIMCIEHSRPVRRAAASLAVALYNAVLREVDGTLQLWQFTIALVNANEGLMKCVLEACMDPMRTHSSQLFDSAVSARCSEALDARRQIEESGAFKIVAIHLDLQQREDSDPTVSFVMRCLDEGHGNGTPPGMSNL